MESSPSEEDFRYRKMTDWTAKSGHGHDDCGMLSGGGATIYWWHIPQSHHLLVAPPVNGWCLL